MGWAHVPDPVQIRKVVRQATVGQGVTPGLVDGQGAAVDDVVRLVGRQQRRQTPPIAGVPVPAQEPVARLAASHLAVGPHEATLDVLRKDKPQKRPGRRR